MRKKTSTTTTTTAISTTTGTQKKPQIVVPILSGNATTQPVSESKKRSKRQTQPLTSPEKQQPTQQHKGPNIILHFKFKLNELYEYQKIVKRFETNDIIYEPIIPPDNYLPYDDIIDHNYASYIEDKPPVTTVVTTPPLTVVETDVICDKLSALKVQLYKNIPVNKSCACFWCSYEYDDKLCYIPKHIINDVVYGYGSFCTPQCAVAFLIKENIDDTTRYERYYLLNYIYGNGKCIKPSPNPFYSLDKYYGNLSIDEYRKLVKSNDYLYITVDKPMTRIFPEVHVENEELLMGNATKNGIGCGNGRTYKVKMQNDPVPQSNTNQQQQNNETNEPKPKVNPFPFLTNKINK
jgi:hypothetical protein